MPGRSDVLLINAPVSARSPHSRLAPPLGLAYIASTLLHGGVTADAADLNVSGLNAGRVLRLLQETRARIVGISALTETYPNAITIARIVKESDPSIAVVLGGAHPTLRPREALQEWAVDFVVIGQGESAMLGLAEHLLSRSERLDNIPGLAYRESSAVDGVRMNPRDRPSHPDDLPYPARGLFPLELYRTPWTVLTARGPCPFRCPFCSSPTLWGDRGRRMARSPEALTREVLFLRQQHGARHVTFVDDLFTIDRDWVREVAERLASIGSPVAWTCATRVDLVDPPTLQAMASAGCVAIQYGVESGAQDLLDSVKQRVRKDQVITAVVTARRLGIQPLCSFMVPFPEDDEATIGETTRFMAELRSLGSEISLSYTTPFPGTRFYEDADALGIRLLTRDWSAFDAKHNVIETRKLRSDAIERLVREMVKAIEISP